MNAVVDVYRGQQSIIIKREEIVHSLESSELLTAGSQNVGLVKMRTRKNDLPILFVFCQYN